MLNKEIYRGALGLLGEPFDEARTEDYADRAPYIIANFISENASWDAKYRAFHGEAAARSRSLSCSSVYASLDGAFPLSARFASAAEYYLASMLIDGEDGDRADDFLIATARRFPTFLRRSPPFARRS